AVPPPKSRRSRRSFPIRRAAAVKGPARITSGDRPRFSRAAFSGVSTAPKTVVCPRFPSRRPLHHFDSGHGDSFRRSAETPRFRLRSYDFGTGRSRLSALATPGHFGSVEPEVPLETGQPLPKLRGGGAGGARRPARAAAP